MGISEGDDGEVVGVGVEGGGGRRWWRLEDVRVVEEWR